MEKQYEAFTSEESITTVKSFKHDGRLHRIWMDNWLVPQQQLLSPHQAQNMLVLVNSHTRIIESDGRQWISRVPGVSFFIPGKWYNIIALLESHGIRYYCNVASPFYRMGNILTYIDYDLDVILNQKGDIYVLDEDEYARHKKLYHYSSVVEGKVRAGLKELLKLAEARKEPFQDSNVLAYYQLWKELASQEGSDYSE